MDTLQPIDRNPKIKKTEKLKDNYYFTVPM